MFCSEVMAPTAVLVVVALSLFVTAQCREAVLDKNTLWSNLTPLQLAAIEGRVEEAEIILKEKRESVNGVNGISPLHWAALRGHVPFIRMLLKFGADIRSLDHEKNTALHMAAVSGSPEAVEELIIAKAEIDAQNNNNNTALHLAVNELDFNVTKTLLRFGALTNITDQEGRSPLDLATEKRNLMMMTLLYSSGAKYNETNTTPKPTLATITTKPPKVQLSKATRRPDLRKLTDKEMRLHQAAKKIEYNSIADLCAEGVDPNVADIDNNGYTPLHLAAAKGIVSLLALARCSANLNAKDFDGNTPLHIAVINDYPWSADLLLMLGANPNIKNNEGKLPQELVTSGKNKNFQSTFNPEKMKWISNVRPFSDSEQNFLKLIRAGVYMTIVDSCKSGVDIHVKDANHNQYTMLHYAASIKTNIAGTIQMLLRCGANINARDADGNTPLHIAVSEKNDESQTVLLLNGADPYIANGAGRTAFQMLKESSPGVVDRLQWYINSMPI